MPEPKAQLVDPQGPIDVPGLSVTGVTTATGGFVGAVQGTATGLASTTANLNVGIVTATKFQGNTTGNVSGLADDTNINVGIITSTSFTGDLVGNAAGLSTTTANIKAGILSATSFAGNFTGVASGITGTPNIVVGIMTGTLNGDGSSLTGIAATNWISNNVTANSSTTTVDLSDGNVVKFTQSANTTVSFANTGTSNIVTFIRDSGSGTLTWPSAIKWDGGSAPTLDAGSYTNDVNVIKLLTRDEGVTWYGWQDLSDDGGYGLFSWGYNAYGALGHNSRTYYSSPTQVGSNAKWKSVDVWGNSRFSATATKTDNTLWTWGMNPGKLGQNNTVQYSSPVQIPGTTWTGAGSGSNGSWIGTKTDGTLWALGDNPSGNLGQNSRTYYSSPVQIPGTTWGTGENKFTHGNMSFMAIKTDGTLWTSGRNYEGNMGLNLTHNTRYSSPVQIPGTTWSSISSFAYGYQAIKTDGTMWVWGWNTGGQLGLNNQTAYSSPVQIPGTTWSSVSTNGGRYAMAAIKTNRTLWTWGAGSNGKLAQNNVTNYSSPRQVGSDTTWSSVSSGAYHMVATKTDGTAWAWGANQGLGSLGQNQGSGGDRSSPIQIPGTWAQMKAAMYFSLGVK